MRNDLFCHNIVENFDCTFKNMLEKEGRHNYFCPFDNYYCSFIKQTMLNIFFDMYGKNS